MNEEKTALLEVECTTENSPLEQLLATRVLAREVNAPKGGARASAPVVGKIVAVTELPLVDFPGNPKAAPIPARHTCPVAASDIGREAVLVFEQADWRRPLILGLLQPPTTQESPAVNITADGEQLTLTAKNEIVLRCGKSSITLTRAGKVLIRGAYLLSRSSGVNRIKGGSVQIN